MKRVLVVYYSQSGDVKRMADALAAPLAEGGVEVTWHAIEPVAEYPYPWRNIHRFFNVMPESVLDLPPEVREPAFAPDAEFDLVILAYQVWFLSPSLPVQGFLQSKHAEVLRGRRVITLCVCRNMWHQASERLKATLADLGAVHADNIVVTHQGPPWATFLTTTRSLFTGKRDRLMGVMPKAGIHEREAERLARLGRTLAAQSEAFDRHEGPFLTGCGAVHVDRKYLVPELIAVRMFRVWARVIRLFGKPGSPWRHVGLFFFINFLLLGILVGLPLTILATLLVYPFIRHPLKTYSARLAQPSGA